MNRDEIIDLLSLIAARDRRTVGNADVLAWSEDVGDLTFADAQAAVSRHFQESRDWIMPADVRRHVRAIRTERHANTDLILPEGDPDDAVSWAKALREIRNRVAGGRMPFRAIEGGKASTKPNAEFKAARSNEDNDRVLSQSIACPVGWCTALAGEPCRTGPLEPPMTKWHASRLQVARQPADPATEGEAS